MSESVGVMRCRRKPANGGALGGLARAGWCGGQYRLGEAWRDGTLVGRGCVHGPYLDYGSGLLTDFRVLFDKVIFTVSTRVA